MRSQVEIDRNPGTGDAWYVAIEVRGGLGKDLGVYYLTAAGMVALVQALESGFLRELEQQFVRPGRDYPLFPGALRGMRLIPGRGRQHRLAPDEVLPV